MTKNESDLSASAHRYLTGIWGSREIDLILRMKADLETSGGKGIRELMGDPEAGEEGYRIQMEGVLAPQLAVKFNTTAAMTAELHLKAILEGTTGKAEKSHRLTDLYAAIPGPIRGALSREYRELRSISATAGKTAKIGSLRKAIEWLDGRFEAYRYLEERAGRRTFNQITEVEAEHWWSGTLAVRALKHGAHTWADLPEETIAMMGQPRNMLVSKKRAGWTGDGVQWRKAQRNNLKKWMQRVLGQDLRTRGENRQEDPCWGEQE